MSAALGGVAWLASPSPSVLAQQVEVHLRGTGGTAIPLSQTPLLLREAVVATEDERFYRHLGIDIIGVIRALPYDLTHLSFAEGASTITEQLAKVLYLDGNDHSPWRKLQDAAVAVKLEDRYSKPRILAAYLNTAYFGDGATGVEAAADRYFAIRARDLNGAQSTLLAGLVQAPSLYDPLRDPTLARARQVDVLRSLVRDKYLKEPAAAALLAQPLRLSNGSTLPPLSGIDLLPGPSFVMWQLAAGSAVMLIGAIALLGTRKPASATPERLLRSGCSPQSSSSAAPSLSSAPSAPPEARDRLSVVGGRVGELRDPITQPRGVRPRDLLPGLDTPVLLVGIPRA